LRRAGSDAGEKIIAAISKSLFLAFSALTALFVADIASAQTITISPANPTTRDAIVVKLIAAPTRWEPAASEVRMAGNKITVSFYSSCLIAVPTADMITAPQELSIGRLPIGQYDVEVSRNNCSGTGGQTRIGSLPLEVIKGLPYVQTGPTSVHDFTDLWWTPTESGWGISIHSKGVNLFAAWFVYSPTRSPIWYTLQGGRWSTPTTYAGKIYQSTGPFFGELFSAVPVKAIEVGTGTFEFLDYSNGTFDFTVNGVAVKKQITRTPF
jgi:hypothetical protein